MHTQTNTPSSETELLAGINRRVQVRHLCQMETMYQIPFGLAKGKPWKGDVQDISAGGIGILCKQWLGIGTLLEVELSNPSKGTTTSLLATVVHATPKGRKWLLGCKFVGNVDEAELKTVL